MLERVLGEVLFGDMYKEYVLHNGCRIFYEEYLGSCVESPVFCWPSSFLLSKYIERYPGLVRNKYVLELGAGIGLPSFVCAALGAKKVYVADQRGNTKVQQLLERNRERNSKISFRMEYYPVNWGDGYPIDMEYPLEQLDIVIGADLFYDPKQMEPLVMTMHSILRYHCSKPIRVYIVYPQRSCKRNIGKK